MNTDNSQHNETINPRYEFRSFGQDFDRVAQRMAQLSDSVSERLRERRSEEIYILSRHNDVNNIKIRYGLMDIKMLLDEVHGLEQWGPIMKAEFPVEPGTLTNQVFPALRIPAPAFDRNSYSLEDFIALIQTQDGLESVNVNKHRYGFSVNETICEMARVEIDSTRLVTVSTESTDINAVQKTIHDLGLTGIENINYLQAIKRVIGMTDKPLAN